MKRSVIAVFIVFYIQSHCLGGTVHLFSFTSKSMGKPINANVILPANYKSSENRYPTLYLLHGAGGDYTNWVNNMPSLKQYVDLYQLIIVCVDGGKTSWYFDSPVDKRWKYETYITKELVPFIDKAFRTKPTRKARAITGLSMGGHGALFLATRHPEIWGAAGSMSGGVDFRDFPKSWDLSKRLGAYRLNKEVWNKHVLVNMLPQLKKANLKLIIDCGVDDFFFDVNMAFHQKMMNEKVPHEFTTRPGAHTWAYWKNSIKYHLVFFDSYFHTKARD